MTAVSNFALLILFSRFSRVRPIIIDPGLYHLKKSGVFWAKEKRSVPASFKVFMGTALELLPFTDTYIICMHKYILRCGYSFTLFTPLIGNWFVF